MRRTHEAYVFQRLIDSELTDHVCAADSSGRSYAQGPARLCQAASVLLCRGVAENSSTAALLIRFFQPDIDL